MGIHRHGERLKASPHVEPIGPLSPSLASVNGHRCSSLHAARLLRSDVIRPAQLFGGSRLSTLVGNGLLGIADRDAELRTVAEQPDEAGHIVRRGDHQHLVDAGEDQR